MNIDFKDLNIILSSRISSISNMISKVNEFCKEILNYLWYKYLM